MHAIPFIAAVISFFAVIGVTVWAVHRANRSGMSATEHLTACLTLFFAGSFGATLSAGVSYAFFSTVVS